MSLDRRGFQDEYPFASHFVDVGGARMHFVDEGQGEPLLMVHGNPTWSFAWRHLIDDLSRDYRVVAVDHIGCGFSDKPQRYRYRLDQHIANLQRLVELLGLRQTTLFAHDWGGPIGLGTAVRNVDRFARFVLFNTAAFRSTRIPWPLRLVRIPLVGSFAVRGLNLLCRAALRTTVVDPQRLTPAIRAGYLAPYRSWGSRVAVLRFVEDIPLQARHPTFSSLAAIEAGLKQLATRPVLLVWGEQDWCFTRDFLHEFQRRLPDAETFALSDAGHYVLEDAWERIVPRVREFLNAHPLE